MAETDKTKDREAFYNYITRDMYKTIKRMDRKNLSDYLYTLYKSIYSDYEGKLQPDYDKIYNEVQKIRGIGEVKSKQIVEVVRDCMSNKDM